MLNLQDVEKDLDNLNRVQSELDRIVSEAGAMGVFLVDENGFLIAESGEVELDRVAMAALVAASFGATIEIAKLLGEKDFSRLIHQGSKRHLFIGKAGERHILIVAFGKETNLGLVKLYADKVATFIGTIMDETAAPPEVEKSEDVAPQPAGESTGTGEGLFPAWLEDEGK